MKIITRWREARENQEGGVELWTPRSSELETAALWLDPKSWGIGISRDTGWFEGRYYNGVCWVLSFGPLTFMWLRNRP